MIRAWIANSRNEILGFCVVGVISALILRWLLTGDVSTVSGLAALVVGYFFMSAVCLILISAVCIFEDAVLLKHYRAIERAEQEVKND